MNSKDLLRAFGDIDEKYLDEEHETPKEKNKKETYHSCHCTHNSYCGCNRGFTAVHIKNG